MIADLPELQKLSGYTRKADVKKWLKENGVTFMGPAVRCASDDAGRH
jgi:hypothetical protein